MAVTIKRAALWRKEITNKPGTLADSLKPLAKAGTNLQTVMGYVFPGDSKHAAVEVYPVAGAGAQKAAKAAGLKSGKVHCLMVQGDDKPGLCHKMAQAISDAKINLNFVVIQVIGKTYSGWFGFQSERDAVRAIPIIKAANMGGSTRIAKAKPRKMKPSKVKKAAKKVGAKVIRLRAVKGKKRPIAKAAMRKNSGKKRSRKKGGKRK